MHVGEAKNERARESVNPLDGCTRTFGFAEADARQLTPVVWSAFFQRDAGVGETVSGDGFAKTRAPVMRLQLLTAVVRYVYFVTQAVCVWCRFVQGEDTGCYWLYRDFWPTPVGPPSRSSLSACARLWVEAARRRSGPWWVQKKKSEKRIIFC